MPETTLNPAPSVFPTFEYGSAKLSELRVTTKTAADKTSRRGTRRVASQVFLNDEPLIPTERFWTSLYIRYGFAKSIFKYFTHEEVFARIQEINKEDRMRFCIETDPQKPAARTLLAVSNPTKPVVRHDDLQHMLHEYNRNGGSRLSYSNGIVESTHNPRARMNFSISGDAFSNQFVLQTPIDGFGMPNVYLSLLREVCSNGMIGYGRTFRSQVNLGSRNDNPLFTIGRVLDGFGNDEGFAAMRQRFEAASESWASVRESLSLYNLTAKLIGRGLLGNDGASAGDGANTAEGVLGSRFLKSFHKMTGDISQLYGLANLDALSSKRQRALPVECKVYDLFNYATELATHHAKTEGARRMQAWMGTMIAQEYDMEGTADHFSDFNDFFVGDTEAKTAAQSN